MNKLLNKLIVEMSRLGIWVDRDKAYLVSLDASDTIGYKTFFRPYISPWQDRNDSLFYEQLLQEMKAVDGVVIFGKDQWPFVLESWMLHQSVSFDLKIKATLNVAEVSLQQLGILVKDFFALTQKEVLEAEHTVGF